MLEELWTEVHDIVQEAVIKTILKVKKCKKAKWLSEEVLQITEKREAKGKGEKERYTQLNAEFQRTAQRDKKVISDQCKEIGPHIYIYIIVIIIYFIIYFIIIYYGNPLQYSGLENPMDRGAW